MHNAEPAPWMWLFGGRYVGLTLTFTRGLSPDALLERYGADPSATRPTPFIDMYNSLQPDSDHSILRVGTLGEWAFGIEDTGVQGADPATLAAMSHGTETISILAGANALDMFEYWLNGQPLEQFEPGNAPTLRAAGAHPFWDAAEQYRAARPGTRNISAVMLAVEDHVGARLAEEADDGPLRSLLLPQNRPTVPSPTTSLPRVYPPAVNSARRAGLGRSLGALRVPTVAPHEPLRITPEIETRPTGNHDQPR